MNNLRVIYISSKRAEERRLLEAASGIAFAEVQLHLSTSLAKYGRAVWLLPQRFRSFVPHVALFEAAGVAALPALLLCRVLRIPHVARLKGDIWAQDDALGDAPVRGFDLLSRCLNRQVALYALRSSVGLLPISQHLADVVDREFAGKKSRFAVPISWDQWVSQASMNARLPHDPQGTPLVLTVTNFNFWGKVKRLAELIPSISAAVTASGGSWLIVGGGSFLGRCQEMWPGFRDIFVGQVDRHRLGEYYSSAALLLYISDLDGMPNVLLEAGLFGLPVVINSDSPAREFISDQRTGVHVDISNHEAMERKLRDLLEDHGRRILLGEALRTHVLSEFSVEQAGRTLEEGIRFALSASS